MTFLLVMVGHGWSWLVTVGHGSWVMITPQFGIHSQMSLETDWYSQLVNIPMAVGDPIFEQTQFLKLYIVS